MRHILRSFYNCSVQICRIQFSNSEKCQPNIEILKPRDLLTKAKTTPPPHLNPNVIFEISCNDCTATYNGQTNRPLIKRIKEHESHSRLHLHNPDDFSHNQSAPAHHSRTTGHRIAWDRTTILATTRYKTQLDLTGHSH